MLNKKEYRKIIIRESIERGEEIMEKPYRKNDRKTL